MNKRKVKRLLWKTVGYCARPLCGLSHFFRPVKAFDFNAHFDHIYVVNLPHSLQRRDHTTKEFARVGITDFEYFKATSKDSLELDNLKASGFIHQPPGCMQCGKCNCACKKKYLNDAEAANFCSMLNVWKDIISKDYQWCLICEDDIQFTPYYKQVLNKLMSATSFDKYHIDRCKPLLIRMSSCSRKDYFYQPVRFSSQQLQSNHCYAINKEMACLLVQGLKQIRQVSDKYIHRESVKNHPEVQHFTVQPLVAHDLSTRARGMMPSEIRLS